MVLPATCQVPPVLPSDSPYLAAARPSSYTEVEFYGSSQICVPQGRHQGSTGASSLLPGRHNSKTKDFGALMSREEAPVASGDVVGQDEVVRRSREWFK